MNELIRLLTNGGPMADLIQAAIDTESNPAPPAELRSRLYPVLNDLLKRAAEGWPSAAQTELRRTNRRNNQLTATADQLQNYRILTPVLEAINGINPPVYVPAANASVIRSISQRAGIASRPNFTLNIGYGAYQNGFTVNPGDQNPDGTYPTWRDRNRTYLVTLQDGRGAASLSPVTKAALRDAFCTTMVALGGEGPVTEGRSSIVYRLAARGWITERNLSAIFAPLRRFFQDQNTELTIN